MKAAKPQESCFPEWSGGILAVRLRLNKVGRSNWSAPCFRRKLDSPDGLFQP